MNRPLLNRLGKLNAKELRVIEAFQSDAEFRSKATEVIRSQEGKAFREPAAVNWAAWIGLLLKYLPMILALMSKKPAKARD